jgi:malonate decarboxylase alpha subunit
VHSFGSELGMEDYVAARPDVFFTGADGSMRSNRALCQLAGQYAVDLFIGSTLQIDGDGHSSTVTRGRLSGFGGAPNMGHNPAAAPRHAGLAGPDRDRRPLARGRKLVVQMVETFQAGGKPTFVESMDAVQVAKDSGMPLAPVMIYGDDVTHVLTEEGIAYLYKARSLEERRRMIAAVAGVTPIGMRHDPATTRQMRSDGLIALPEDLGVHRARPRGRCWPPRAWPIWSNGRAACTTRPRASGAGDGPHAALPRPACKRTPHRPARAIGDLAVAVLIDEATLAPSPDWSTRAATAAIATCRCN